MRVRRTRPAFVSDKRGAWAAPPARHWAEDAFRCSGSGAQLQLVAALRPRAAWTIQNVYGGSPEATDPKAYFAFNQGMAWADPFLWAPVQFAGSAGMLMGERWGFLLALMASVPFC